MASQKTQLAALRKSIMSGASTYADGTDFDYSVSGTPFYYFAPISSDSESVPPIGITDDLFNNRVCAKNNLCRTKPKRMLKKRQPMPQVGVGARLCWQA
ncbi:MAG: hypothetical protein ACR2I0_12075 [Rhodoferax sp.]